MDQTDCLGIPYPQCDPPLTKDASDIEQFRDLALAVDSAVAALESKATELLFTPDACNLNGGATVAGRIQDIPYTTSNFDNAGMLNAVVGRMEIQSSGWYMLGGHVSATHNVPTGIGMRVQPTLNGDPVSNKQGPGRPTLTGASSTDDVGWACTLFLNPGDLIGVRTNHNDSAALVVTYNSALWGLRILANV